MAEAPTNVEEPEFQRVMECIFDIQDHELKAFTALTERPGSTVAELATHLERDRSNVNRSLSSLRETGLIERERRLLDGGGYVYQYYASSTEETRDRLHEAVDVWCESVHERIDEFVS